MQIKYVGLKNSESAFSRETGIIWTPGASHDVDPDIAKLMLRHPDVFAESQAVVNIDEMDNDALYADQGVLVHLDSVVNLDDLDRDALHKLARQRGITVHHKAGSAKVIEALKAAQ